MSGTNIDVPVPAPERAVVGLCHKLNDQLASVEAYLYLMERDKNVERSNEALRMHLDRIAEITRQIRSLCRDEGAEPSPIGIGTLFDAANEIMASYPEGAVRFAVDDDDRGRVVFSDWSSALRASLDAGAWLSNGLGNDIDIEVGAELAEDGRTTALRLTATSQNGEDPGAPPFSSGDPLVFAEVAGPRSLRLVVRD